MRMRKWHWRKRHLSAHHFERETWFCSRDIAVATAQPAVWALGGDVLQLIFNGGRKIARNLAANRVLATAT